MFLILSLSKDARAVQPMTAAMKPADPRTAIRTEALALGFDAVGFAPAALAAATRTPLSELLAGGRQRALMGRPFRRLAGKD